MRRAFFVLVLVVFGVSAYGKVKVTNEMIYEKLIEIEKRQAVLEAQFGELRHYVDKRFEDINRMFDDINKRFEDINKRFEDINRRFDLINERFEDINKRFEDINKRFEDMNKRFESLQEFLWVLSGIFTSLVAVVIGFAYWDRRTVIRKAKEETLEELERYVKAGKAQEAT